MPLFNRLKINCEPWNSRFNDDDSIFPFPSLHRCGVYGAEQAGLFDCLTVATLYDFHWLLLSFELIKRSGHLEDRLALAKE